MKQLTHFFLALLPALAITAAAHAGEPTEPSLEVTIDIADPGHQLKPINFTLTLAGLHGCASVEDRNAGAEHHVKACRDVGPETAPLVAFDLDRTLNRDQGSERRQFRVKASLPLGRTQLIARLGEGDQVMEVRATARPAGEKRG